jgi:hypothetical protein
MVSQVGLAAAVERVKIEAIGGESAHVAIRNAVIVVERPAAVRSTAAANSAWLTIRF